MRGMLCGVQISEQFRADALEGLLQQIEAIAEGLITRKERKPVSPIIYNQIVDLLFRKFSALDDRKTRCKRVLGQKIEVWNYYLRVENKFGNEYRKYDRQTDKVESVDFP